MGARSTNQLDTPGRRGARHPHCHHDVVVVVRRVADAAEESLARRRGADLVNVVIKAYTYGHFVVIAGIVVVAFGVEEALAHAGDASGFGAFNAGALSFGAATYVFGSAAFWFALERKVVWSRIVGAAALLAAWPVLAAVRPLAGLAIGLAILTAVAAVEVGQLKAS